MSCWVLRSKPRNWSAIVAVYQVRENGRNWEEEKTERSAGHGEIGRWMIVELPIWLSRFPKLRVHKLTSTIHHAFCRR